MISLDTLLNLLTLNDSINLNDFLATLLTAPQLVLLFEKSPKLKKMLQRELPQIKAALTEQLKNTPVPENLAQEFAFYTQIQSLTYYPFTQQLQQTCQQLEALNSPFHAEAQSLLKQTESQQLTPAQQSLFMQRWRMNLTLQALTLNDDLLEQHKQRLIEELKKQLAMSGFLSPLLADDEEISHGKLWDLSKSSLHTTDSDRLTEYSHFLRSQPQLNELAQKLGRSRESKAIAAENTQLGPVLTTETVRHSFPEEVQGVYQSDDVLRLLPAELATLSLNELEVEFYRKLIEKRLLTYQLRGQDHQPKIKERPVIYQQKEQQPKGPFIVCIDTSGSMGGFNERCAKAFCLALLKIAFQENRRCFVMMFTQEIIQYELTAESGMPQLLRFLSQRFRGGTDIEYCLEEAVKLLQTETWQEADIVVISDFIAQRLSDDTQRRIRTQQQDHQQRFHAVTLSQHGKPRLLSIFDFIWPFDTGLKSRLKRYIRR
ncbi:ATPase RavA stimulator ViaA [Rosenbergiella australiborealis]|uniref:ATPase RavA stimulator ViaA n=1 Tax=Rosenbergiella australiborealis TaxID=1544696 RepID=A0ABS5T666_9GAMM|nr:ATPase RavA stimulator ViaA [Rosenbergiella australiborealis]MBT0727840.1 ATPase RavA stimulator ViaA [Rosenbergiella australiborealis]